VPTSNANENPPEPTIPFVDEANPGLGRRSGWLEQQRRDSGGLDDSSPENPVRDDNPIK
jgi:hypothetical protein